MDNPLTDFRMAFVGTYPPRRCGIATFTRDLVEATRSTGDCAPAMTIAVTDPGGQYDYPADVEVEIRHAVKGDYTRAAEIVNFSDVRLVSIQHEYGIFGGDDGAYILDFLMALRVPAIVTLHTVLKQPSESQRSIVRKMAKRCAGLVVMSRVAAELLASSYGVDAARVSIIAHGIPDMRPRDQAKLKAKFGVAGQPMLLTFGLLSPNKGVETVIRALPAAVQRFRDLVYFVVGATHPMVARRHGEEYRTSLEREAEKLGVRDHVVFRDQFVGLEELTNYLQAADIFVSPYLAEAQVTSGALSYAMGAGAAVISTPYWHAQELLAEGRGRFFPFGDSAALSKVIVSLLGSPDELHRVRTTAYEHTRPMIWPRIGRTYVDHGRKLVADAPTTTALPRPERASTLPDLRLDHLIRMTDDTGIIQHATYSIPARRSGYCVDDNARALIVALEVDRIASAPDAGRLVTTYLSYLHDAQKDDGTFVNFMSYERTLVPGAPSDDCQGRALWALGATVQLAADDGCRLLARDMFEKALPGTAHLGPRGAALSILGMQSLLAADPNAGHVRAKLAVLADEIVDRYQKEAAEDWRWFEPALTYDNAIIPLALFKAYGVTGDRASLRAARESLEFLEEVCFSDAGLSLVGNGGWHTRGGTKAPADEQPIDASAFVLAFRGAYLATHDHHYLRRMRESFAWFLGANRLGLPLYDATTSGCRDGLGDTALNLNQGAESTLCFLMALLEMLELAGEGLEHADTPPPAVA